MVPYGTVVSKNGGSNESGNIIYLEGEGGFATTNYCS